MLDKWQGWAAAGAVLMMIVGVFKAISGIIALFNDEWIIRGFSAYYFIDLSALGWWYLGVGILLVLAGWAIFLGQTWGRWVGVIFVSLAMISELFWVPVYPFWSVILLVIYALVLYGLIVAKPIE